MTKILKIEDWKNNKPQFKFSASKSQVKRLKDGLIFIKGRTPLGNIEIVRFHEDLIHVDLSIAIDSSIATGYEKMTKEINKLPALCGHVVIDGKLCTVIQNCK